MNDVKQVTGRGGWVYRVGRAGIQVKNPETGALTVLGPELFAAGARGPKADMARAIGKELLTDFPDIAGTMMDKTMGLGLDYRDIKAFENATPIAPVGLTQAEREYEQMTLSPAEREYAVFEQRSDRREAQSRAEENARAAAEEKFGRVTTREPMAGTDKFARRAMGSSFGEGRPGAAREAWGTVADAGGQLANAARNALTLRDEYNPTHPDSRFQANLAHLSSALTPADEATPPRTAAEKFSKVTTREPMAGTEEFTQRAMTPMSGERSPATTSFLYDLYAKLGIITEEERASLDSNQGRVPRG